MTTLEESFNISKWQEWNNDAPKKDKYKHTAVALPAIAASGVGGYKMGNAIGRTHETKAINRELHNEVRPSGFKANAKDLGNSAKRAAKTKNFKVGAGLAAAGIGAAAVNDKHHMKKGTIVRKNSEVSAFGVNHGYQIEKAFTGLKALAATVPKQRAASNKLTQTTSRLDASMNAHKGSLPAKTRSDLPLKARKVMARHDRDRGRV